MEAEHQHEAEPTEATTLDFDFTQFMLSTAADPQSQSPATTTQTSSARQNQPYPAFQLEDPSGLPSPSSGLLQRRAAAAAVAFDAKQLQNGANTFDFDFDFDALSHADIDALTAAGYLSFPMPDIANTNITTTTATTMSAPSSSTTSPAVPAQPFQLETMSSHINTTSQPASIDPTTSPSRSKRRRSIDASSSTTASKAHYPSVRPGPKPAQPSALRSFLRAQAQANAEGTRSNSNSNDSWGNTTSTSARSFVTDFSARAIRSDGSYGSTTTIRSGSVGVGAGANVRGSAGLSFAGAGASMMMGAPPDAHGGCGCGCGGWVENVLPAGWVFVGLLDGRMTIPTELLAKLQIPYSALSSSSYPNTTFLRNSQSSRYNPPAPSSPLLPPPPSTARPFFHSRADTPSSSPVALFAHTTARATQASASASAQVPTSPLAGGGEVVAMDEGDEGGGDARADTESKLAGPGADVVNGERDVRAGVEPDETVPAAAAASVEREEEIEEEGMMRFYALTKREMELLLHWLRFGIVPKHVRADLDQLGLLADRYELKELIEAVRDAKDTRYMSIKERAEFDGKAVGEMQRHLGSLVLWPDPTRSKAESDKNTTTNNNSSSGGNGTLAATIAGPSYQAVCAVLDDELWDLAPSTRKLVRVDFRFPLAMARQGAISPFGSDQVRELQGQPGWDSLASSSSGRQTLWNTYRDDANRQVWHRIFFDMVAKRLWTDGFVIEREMVDCISSNVFYLISR
ncbi:unnamed protein product [Tilletia controversa]|nr:unnamed protein product [Tilletia controversa]